MDSSNPPRHDAFEEVGAVVIGRNEGTRLERCLRSILSQVCRVIYVDSGSTDGSAQLAGALGVNVITLTDAPFTAARGRQVGLDWLIRDAPALRYVQFVDGDCILQPGWIAAARARVAEDPRVVAVTGQVREERAKESVYSRMVDSEWNAPPGETNVFGGNVFGRIEGFRQVRWCSGLIAGEELDLSMRLRARGWRIVSLADGMVLHDIAIDRFGTFWQRAIRSGHSYGQMALLHCRPRWIVRVLGSLFYGLALPLLGLVCLALWPMGIVAVCAAYLVGIFRLIRWRLRIGDAPEIALRCALITLLCKSAMAWGVMRFLLGSLTGRASPIIEYKRPGALRNS